MVRFAELLETAIANAESRAALAASRARIVATADETRRRIERNLHDGTQQQLVSLILELRVAVDTESPEVGELKAQLARTSRGLVGVLEELQRNHTGDRDPARRPEQHRDVLAVEGFSPLQCRTAATSRSQRPRNGDGDPRPAERLGSRNSSFDTGDGEALPGRA
jgi:hypothetical protein